MPHTETTTRTLYKFDELGDAAKEKAREWYRSSALDYEWWDSVYEDAARMGALIGIQIGTKGKNTPPSTLAASAARATAPALKAATATRLAG